MAAFGCHAYLVYSLISIGELAPGPSRIPNSKSVQSSCKMSRALTSSLLLLSFIRFVFPIFMCTCVCVHLGHVNVHVLRCHKKPLGPIKVEFQEFMSCQTWLMSTAEHGSSEITARALQQMSHLSSPTLFCFKPSLDYLQTQYNVGAVWIVARLYRLRSNS